MAAKTRRAFDDFDAQLLAQLTYQRLSWLLTRLELPAREFPIAGIRRLRQALGEQYASMAIRQNAGGHAHERTLGHRFCAFFKPMAPARSRANCHATLPLRYPR